MRDFSGFTFLGSGAACLVAAEQLLQSSRDFDADRLVGLRTSAALLGKKRSIRGSTLLTLLGACVVWYFFWYYTKVVLLESKLDTFILAISFLFYLIPLLPKLRTLGTGDSDLVAFESAIRQSSYAVYFMLVAYSLLVG
jgi:4-hydroxybenzoate polyprenyltransferase